MIDDLPEVKEARKGLRCLYIAVDYSVARDISARVEAAFKAIEEALRATSHNQPNN